VAIKSETDIIIEECKADRLIDSASLERVLCLLAGMACRRGHGLIKNRLEGQTRGVTADDSKGYSSRKSED
jgi:hypothetical protein